MLILVHLEECGARENVREATDAKISGFVQCQSFEARLSLLSSKTVLDPVARFEDETDDEASVHTFARAYLICKLLADTGGPSGGSHFRRLGRSFTDFKFVQSQLLNEVSLEL